MCPREKDLPPRGVPLVVVLHFVPSRWREYAQRGCRCAAHQSETAGRTLSSAEPRNPTIQRRASVMKAWFVPPLVIPIFVVLMVVALAAYQATWWRLDAAGPEATKRLDFLHKGTKTTQTHRWSEGEFEPLVPRGKGAVLRDHSDRFSAGSPMRESATPRERDREFDSRSLRQRSAPVTRQALCTEPPPSRQPFLACPMYERNGTRCPRAV